MTASRWLNDPRFKESFDSMKKASADFMKKALAPKESQKPK
jgi:hypothetical protein